MRSLIVGSVLALATLLSVPAFAKQDEASFPMPAAQFKQKVDARLAKARTHMEERASKLPANEAKDLRAKFDAGAAKINGEVAKATADGTVTLDEAKGLRQTMREIRGHHGKTAKRGDAGKNKK
jgi:hypothetical protein